MDRFVEKIRRIRNRSQSPIKVISAADHPAAPQLAEAVDVEIQGLSYEIYFYSPILKDSGSDISDEKQQQQLRSLAKSIMVAHDQIMATRVIELMQQAFGRNVLVALFMKPWYELSSDEQQQIGLVLENKYPDHPGKIEKIVASLKERSRTWCDQRLFFSRGMSGSFVTEVCVEETDEQRHRRRTFYWLRDVSDDSDLYTGSKGEPEYDPILIGIRRGQQNGEIIGTAQAIGYERIWGLEFRNILE